MCLHSCTKTAILSDSSCYSDLIETAGTVFSMGEQCSAGEQCSVTATVLRVERIKISGTVFSTMNSVPYAATVSPCGKSACPSFAKQLSSERAECSAG